MPKRAVQFLAFATMGAFLAVLVFWVNGPSQRRVASLETSRQTSREIEGTSEFTEVVAPPVQRRTNAELDASQPTDRSRHQQQNPPMAFGPRPVGTDGVSTVIDSYEEGDATSGAYLNAQANAIESDDRDSSSEPPEDEGNSGYPLGWCSATIFTRNGTDPAFVSDASAVWSGSRSVFIPPGAPHSLWQGVDATPFRSSRVRVSVHVQTPGDVELALVVHREDQPAPVPWLSRTVALTRLAPGSATRWTQVSVVGHIPEEADFLYYVVARTGEAPLWADEVRVERVGPEQPITGAVSHRAVVHWSNPITVLAAPTNLDFEFVSASGKGTTNAPGPYCANIQIL